MIPAFVHLRLHTEYSISDGMVRIKPLMAATAAAKMPAIAMSDLNNLFAAVKFYKAALVEGIKPIIAADINILSANENPTISELCLICQDNIGYHNLIKLISRAYIEGQDKGQPLVEKSWLTQESVAGLIALSAAHAGDIGQAILNNNLEQAQSCLQYWHALFPQRFYIELQRIGLDNEDAYISAAVSLAQKQQVPVVATNNVRFLTADDYEAHEARVCINGGWVLHDARRPRPYTVEQYLKTPMQMQELFADIPSALTNSVEIAKRCNVKIKLGEVFLPDFPIPAGMTVASFLEKQAHDGLAQRLAVLFDSQADNFADIKANYIARLDLELSVINNMGYPGYFLIVADFIRWAKDNGIPVGPGRGSGAGSLVAYALEITDLDPIRYDLLFERFLNPERVSMPDFDVDFCMDGRDRVIEYVANTYGRDSVSQIITYGTMAAKAVVRDVGRVLGHPYGFVDKLAKLIPFELGMTLNKALQQEDALMQRYREEDEVTNLINLALKLEGITRNAGKHAGGVVIAPSKLTDFTALYCEENGASLVSQFDKDDVEAVGLVKFDFLGLRTLTIIDWALQAINKKRAQQDQAAIDIARIPLDDVKTFDLLKATQTTAVFQLESRGMKDLIKRLQPDCFEDIIALVALFRPGPLQSGMVDDFIDRKHGRALVEYPHPDLEPILRPTYGVILYQEQVMQIAQVLAGYSLGGADLLRRAMGKKKPEEMAKQRNIFVEGASQRGVAESTATSIFDLMEKFAGYGFNKSHSAAYALVSYQTAWLKAYYPAEFMAAVLSADMDNTDKVVHLLDECRQLELALVSPDINIGHYKFTVNADNQVVYGLGAIKGLGEAVIQDFVTERDAHGSFSDLFNFCQRVNLKKLNRRSLEALVRSGAMDSLGAHRGSLFASLEKALHLAGQEAQNQARGQTDLFASDGLLFADTQTQYVTCKPWTDKQRLIGEKETLGLYLTGHPIEAYLPELKNFITARLSDLKPSRDESLIVAGLVLAVRIMQTKRGNRMAFVTLDDCSGRLELAVFADAYQDYRDLLIKDQLIIVEGNVSIDDYTGGYKMSAKRIFNMEQAREVYGRALELSISSHAVNSEFIENLKQCLQPYTGSGGLCQVTLNYQQMQASAQIKLGPRWRVRPSDNLLNDLKKIIGDNAVTLCY